MSFRRRLETLELFQVTYVIKLDGMQFTLKTEDENFPIFWRELSEEVLGRPARDERTLQDNREGRSGEREKDLRLPAAILAPACLS